MLVNVLFSLLDSFKNVGTVGVIEHNGVSVKSRVFAGDINANM